jgi:hypothetical protein
MLSLLLIIACLSFASAYIKHIHCDSIIKLQLDKDLSKYYYNDDGTHYLVLKNNDPIKTKIQHSIYNNINKLNKYNTKFANIDKVNVIKLDDAQYNQLKTQHKLSLSIVITVLPMIKPEYNCINYDKDNYYIIDKMYEKYIDDLKNIIILTDEFASIIKYLIKFIVKLPFGVNNKRKILVIIVKTI